MKVRCQEGNQETDVNVTHAIKELQIQQGRYDMHIDHWNTWITMTCCERSADGVLLKFRKGRSYFWLKWLGAVSWKKWLLSQYLAGRQDFSMLRL